MKVCAYCKFEQHENCLIVQGRECGCEICREAPDLPEVQKYVYGLDPASKNDYFGIVCHSVGEFKPPPTKYLPELRTLRAFTHIPFDQALEILQHELFPKYPPYLMVIDYTNEKTFTDMLTKSYGEQRVMPIKFTNPNKKMLKDDGLSILKQGYQFPNPNLVKDPQLRKWIVELVRQLQSESLIYSKSGQETFDHPQGQHNDISTAWELSIHGCMKLILKKGSTAVLSSVEPKANYNYYDSGEDLFPELQKSSIYSYQVSGN